MRERKCALINDHTRHHGDAGLHKKEDKKYLRKNVNKLILNVLIWREQLRAILRS